MPEPPDVGLFTKWFLENPYPVGGGLVLVAVVLGYAALREGRADRIRVAAVAGLLGILVIALGFFVVTPGEHGKRLTRAFVNAVVDNDLVAADGLLADDARLHLASPTNPGYDVATLLDKLDGLTRRYQITDNTITHLRGYGLDGDRAEVHLACWTETSGFGGYTPSQWVLRVRREPDGSWTITDLTCITVSGKPPRLSW